MNGIFIRMSELTSIQTGNAITDAAQRGWFVGHFIPEELGLRHSEDVEMRWAVHATGEERADWVTGETRTAICILISGEVEFTFRNQDGERQVVLAKQGDFVMWGPGDDHKWRAPVEAITLAVRWPSIQH